MEAPLDGTRSPRLARGFTLIEIVVVLFILGVVIAMAATVTRALTASQRLSTTTTRMQAVDATIVQFVMLNKRLPCPADGTLGSSNAAAGTEGARNTTTGCTTNEAGGVVPWRTLGLAEQDVTDGWNHRLTYRVQPALAADSGLDMSWCDPAGTGALGAGNTCNTTCTSATVTTNCTPPSTYIAGKGLEVHNVANTVLMNPAAAPSTGAAYVVISAGSTGGGAYLSSGQLGTTTTTDGTQEQKNYASAAYVAGTTYYVDDSISDVPGATHFDDIVSRPALLTVINKAGLGPRSHS